jgi:hypothetical protein
MTAGSPRHSIRSAVRTAADRAFGAAMNRTARTGRWDELRLAVGQHAIAHIGRLERIDTLADAECRVFSQWGEDGIIEWLIRRLPGIPETFVEFGVEDYTEANTRFLLNHRNWRGLVIDGSPTNIAAINGRDDHWRHDLTARCAFITTSNINDVLAEGGAEGEIGILSVDIDGNDYWVLDAIDRVQAWIVIAEYNAILGDVRPLTIPYDAGFVRSPDKGAQVYYGAAIGALEHWAAAHGYVLVGTNRAGSNAFFVHVDRADAVLSAVTSTHPRPSRLREARDSTGALTMQSGVDRVLEIRGMPLVDVRTGDTTSIDRAEDAYSDAWMRSMTRGTPLPIRHP